MLRAKQKGFTLLELLVVITLLAILSVGALVAYEGIGDNAQATAAANNTASADRAIRNYRAVSQNYPDQWDSLVVSTGGSIAFVAESTYDRVMDITLPASNTLMGTALNTALSSVGITEIQQRNVGTKTLNVEPNLQHNEGALALVGATADGGDADWGDLTHISAIPTFGDGAACVITGVTVPGTTVSGETIGASAAAYLNSVNDSLEDDQCNLVLALGFGHDAANSTAGSSVAISTAPTYTSKTVNPAETYARYLALFHVASDADENGTIAPTEVFRKARLLAVVDTEGHVIDTNIANSNPTDTAN
jgi:prepilin-type N-terminal cleavage/methylation domain-containing protein